MGGSSNKTLCARNCKEGNGERRECGGLARTCCNRARIRLGSRLDPESLRSPICGKTCGSGSDPGWIQLPSINRLRKHAYNRCKKCIGSDWIQNLFNLARIRLDSMLDPPPFDQRTVRTCAGRVRNTHKHVRTRLGSRLDPIAPDQPIVQKRQYSLQHAWDLEDSRTRLVLLGSSSDSRWIQPSFD